MVPGGSRSSQPSAEPVDRSTVRSAVLEYIEKHKSDYQTVAKKITTLFDEYRATKTGRMTIYRVASRKDYQGDASEIKSTKSIVEKILDHRQEQARKGNLSNYTITDLDDIIGVRAICGYPSDIKLIQRYVAQLDKEGEIRLIGAFEKKLNPSGYRSIHAVLSIPGSLSHIKCELQILTILEEAWGYKTHPLTYKGRNVDSTDKRETELLSRFLHDIDAQSEVVKDKIRQRTLNEDAEHAALIRTHLVNIFNGEDLDEVRLSKALSLADLRFAGVDKENAMKDFRAAIHNEKQTLLNAKTRSATALRILSAAQEYNSTFDVFSSINNYALCTYLSRIFSLAAFCEDSGQYHEMAIHYAHLVFEYAKAHSPSDLPAAYLHEGWSYFCAGNFEDAVSCMDASINQDQSGKPEEIAEMVNNDLAYFVACWLELDATASRGKLGATERTHLLDRASSSIDWAIQSVQNRFPQDSPNRKMLLLQFGDTKGYLQIIGSDKIDIVKQGIAQCTTLLENITLFSAQLQEVAKLYANNHIKKGHQKLVGLM